MHPDVYLYREVPDICCWPNGLAHMALIELVHPPF